MRYPAGLFFAVLFLGFATSWGFLAFDRIETLAAENENLRLRDANRVRISELHKGKRRVVTPAIAKAAYDLGTDAGILLAVAQAEQGGPIYEMGHSGKTAFIWANVAPEEIQEYEAARTLNRALWKWALADPVRKRDAIRALGKAYTHPVNASKWARNVSRLEAQK